MAYYWNSAKYLSQNSCHKTLLTQNSRPRSYDNIFCNVPQKLLFIINLLITKHSMSMSKGSCYAPFFIVIVTKQWKCFSFYFSFNFLEGARAKLLSISKMCHLCDEIKKYKCTSNTLVKNHKIKLNELNLNLLLHTTTDWKRGQNGWEMNN